MNTAPFSSWDDATSLIPWGAESFGEWLFLALAVLAFIAVLVRAVQHENDCMVHVVRTSTSPRPTGGSPSPSGPSPSSERSRVV